MTGAAPSLRTDGLFTIDFARIPLEPFSEMPPELRTERFFRVNELTNAYVDARTRDVVAQMGVSAPVAADRSNVWQWLQRKLACAGKLTPGAVELRRLILEELPALGPALDLIDAAFEGYPGFLRGERTGSSILFDPGAPELWNSYFSNANPLYAAGNILAAHAAALALDDQGGVKSSLRILEVGAGCGSAAEALIARLAGRIESYRLTDISPGFLRKARERLDVLEAAGPIARTYQLLDLNRPSSTWRLPALEVDLIHAVNVLHSVRDVVATLGGLGELLAPGGLLVLGECIRPARGQPVHPEFVFQLLDEFRNVTLDPLTRPEPGFLDAASWRASLEQAGFHGIRFVPDFVKAVAAYPAHSLGAITARRD